jgi:hypothetical protein
MTKQHKPRRGPGYQWIYPKSEDVLEECGLRTIGEYIDIRWQTIAVYVATRPILDKCEQGVRKRGAIPRRWWWEQKMSLDVADATGSDECWFLLLFLTSACGNRNATAPWLPHVFDGGGVWWVRDDRPMCGL